MRAAEPKMKPVRDYVSDAVSRQAVQRVFEHKATWEVARRLHCSKFLYLGFIVNYGPRPVITDSLGDLVKEQIARPK